MFKIIVASIAVLVSLQGPLCAQETTPPATAAQAQAPAAAAAPAVEAPAAATATADDVPQAVKDACQGDFEKFCSQHEPGSTEVRLCMAGAFEKLSETCVTAILDSPLADQAAEQVEAARAAETEAQSDSAALGEAAAPPSRAKRSTRTARIHAPAWRSTHVAHHGKRATHAKVTVRLNRVRPAAHKNVRYAAYRSSKPKARRSVAGYIKRGTRIANYYVAKYTRIGFAKAFR